MSYYLLLYSVFFCKQGAGPSINQPGNSALACVLRHVRDWEFRYELLDMLLQHGGNPNVVGRDGSVPLMVCLVPLINKDPLHHFTHTMKVTIRQRVIAHSVDSLVYSTVGSCRFSI